MNDEKLGGTLVYLEWAIIGWLEGSSHCIPTYKDVGTLGQVHADVGLAPQSKGHTDELKQPEGVVTAVLGMSPGSTGIWWYALTRSILLKIVAPRSEDVKSCRWGTGYWSGTVVRFRAR